MKVTTVTGRVDDMQQREANGGRHYVRVRFAGEKTGFFDWDGKLAEARVQVGDEIALDHTGGDYPRVKAVKKLGSGSGGPAASGDAAAQPNGRPTWRDVQIVRMTCLKAAACLLQNSAVEADERTEQVTKAAERMENWVLREM